MLVCDRVKAQPLVPLTGWAALTFLLFVTLLWTNDVFADDNDNNPDNQKWISAINADDWQEISLLIDQQKEVDVRSNGGKTALMVAAKAGKSDLIHKLIARGADPHAQNNNQGTPIMFACISGDLPSIKTLLNQAVDINQKGSNGWGALMVAAAKGHVQAVKLLLAEGADANTHDVYFWTPLHRASYENRDAVVRELLNVSGLNIDAKDDQGATALHHAASKGNLRIVSQLLDMGADPMIADANGRTVQTYASQSGHDELLAWLKDNDG